MIRRKSKAQSAIEFLIVTAMVAVAAISFIFVLQGNSTDKLKEQYQKEFLDFAFSLQKEILLAAKASEGYQRAFIIPQKINNREYNVTIAEETLLVKTLDEKYAASLPVGQVQGQFVIGSNTIKKQNGQIFLNQ